MPAGAEHALNFHHIDAKLISEDITHNLGETAMLIHDGWTAQKKGETKLQPEYTQSCQVCVASSKVAVYKTNFKLFWLESGWVGGSNGQLRVHKRSVHWIINDIIVQHIGRVLWNIHSQGRCQHTRKYIEILLETWADLQKEVKEENTLMLDNTKMLLNDKQNYTQ